MTTSRVLYRAANLVDSTTKFFNLLTAHNPARPKARFLMVWVVFCTFCWTSLIPERKPVRSLPTFTRNFSSTFFYPRFACYFFHFRLLLFSKIYLPAPSHFLE